MLQDADGTGEQDKYSASQVTYVQTKLFSAKV